MSVCKCVLASSAASSVLSQHVARGQCDSMPVTKSSVLNSSQCGKMRSPARMPEAVVSTIVFKPNFFDGCAVKCV